MRVTCSIEGPGGGLENELLCTRGFGFFDMAHDQKTQPGPVQPQSSLVPPITEALLRLSSLREAGRHRKALNSEGNMKKTTGADMQ